MLKDKLHVVQKRQSKGFKSGNFGSGFDTHYLVVMGKQETC